jgi:superfamily II DNA/RNA helicase
MSFKKIKPEVVNALKFIEIEGLKDEVKPFFSTIKSGRHTMIVSPENTGKTTTAIVTIFNKVNTEFEGSPRVIYLTNSVENAEDVYKKVALVCRKLDITADLVHDKGNIVQQRNDIFDGTEIIVANPKRAFDLYLQNGLNFNLLELFIVDDFDKCIADKKQAELKRMIESLPAKAQVVLFLSKLDAKSSSFIDNLEIDFTIINQE